MKGQAALMGATIAMVAAVAMVVLVLFAELYCTLLLRKRRHPNTTTSTAAAAGSPSSLCSFYTQGVIRAPISFLFPEAPPPPPENPDSEKQLFHNNLRYSSPDSSTASAEHLVYISNPMYDGKRDTPFETPASSPSHLDIIETGSGGSGGITPPLSPMKMLEAEGPSVSLRDGGSICTTASDSNTFFDGASSSSPSTSPSW